MDDLGDIKRGIQIDINATGQDVLETINLQMQAFESLQQQVVAAIASGEQTHQQNINSLKQLISSYYELNGLMKPFLDAQKGFVEEQARLQKNLSESEAKAHEEHAQKAKEQQDYDEQMLQHALERYEKRDQAERAQAATFKQNANTYIADEKQRLAAADATTAQVEATYQHRRAIIEADARLENQLIAARIEQDRITRRLAAGQQELAGWEQEEIDRLRQTTTATVAATGAKRRLTEEEERRIEMQKSQARLILFASQALQDLSQSGFGAIINNLPLITMEVGRLAGMTNEAAIALAGKIGVLGVGLDLIWRNMPKLREFKDALGMDTAWDRLAERAAIYAKKLKEVETEEYAAQQAMKARADFARQAEEQAAAAKDQASRVGAAISEIGPGYLLGQIKGAFAEQGVGENARQRRELYASLADAKDLYKTYGGAFYFAYKGAQDRVAAYEQEVQAAQEQAANQAIADAKASPQGLEQLITIMRSQPKRFDAKSITEMERALAGQDTSWQEKVHALDQLTPDELARTPIAERPEIKALTPDELARMQPHLRKAEERRAKEVEKRQKDRGNEEDRGKQQAADVQAKNIRQRISETAADWKSKVKDEVYMVLADLGVADQATMFQEAKAYIRDKMIAAGVGAGLADLAAEALAKDLVSEYRAEFADQAPAEVKAGLEVKMQAKDDAAAKRAEQARVAGLAKTALAGTLKAGILSGLQQGYTLNEMADPNLNGAYLLGMTQDIPGIKNVVDAGEVIRAAARMIPRSEIASAEAIGKGARQDDRAEEKFEANVQDQAMLPGLIQMARMRAPGANQQQLMKIVHEALKMVHQNVDADNAILMAVSGLQAQVNALQGVVNQRNQRVNRGLRAGQVRGNAR